MKLCEQYEAETGEKATYRMRASDYHTLRYVRWLEKQIDTLKKEVAELKLKTP